MILILLLIGTQMVATYAVPIYRQEIQRVGQVIYQNECGGNEQKLIFWNEREEFPSLGIGHFIWHTKSTAPGKTQQFPGLIAFLKRKKIMVPSWLQAPYNPWQDRKDFLADQTSDRMRELQKLLIDTIPLQAEFIVERFEKLSVNSILKTLNHLEQKKFKKQLDRLMAVPGGYVAIIDYTNFKGDGTNPEERYANQGWGLMQVLLNMKETNNPLHDFVTSAQNLLTQRVAHAAVEKNEQRWLPGWNKRVNRYLSIE